VSVDPIILSAYIAAPGDLNHSVDEGLDLKEFEWEDIFMDEGRFSFRVPVPRPPELITGAVVVLEVNGVKAQQVGIVKQVDEVTLGEPADLGVFVSGALLASALKRGCVQPVRGYGAAPFADVRTYNVFSPAFAITGWGTASAIVAHQGWESASYTGKPSGWSYPDAVLIGPQNGTDHSGEIGQWWTQADFTCATKTNVVFDCAADNWAEVWLDGQMLGTVNGWGSTTSFVASCGPGTHRIGAKVYNTADYSSDKPPLNSGGVVTEGNPTFFLLAAFPVDYKGQRGPLLIQTDTTWKIRAFLATAPGWTFGQVALHVLQQIQLDGELLGWFPNWNALIDSQGMPWPTYETITMDVGRDFLNLLQEWGTSYCDWMPFAVFEANRYELNLYNWTQAPLYAADLDYLHDSEDPDASTVRTLKTTTTEMVADNVMVRWAGGFLREPAEGGTKQAFLKMGNCQNETEARVVAHQWLLVYGRERVRFAAKVAPNNADPYLGNIPYMHYQVGNELAIQGTHERVVRIHLTKTDAGADVDIDTKDHIAYVEDRLEWALHRLSDGT
jgi:hypothetical protein